MVKDGQRRAGFYQTHEYLDMLPTSMTLGGVMLGLLCVPSALGPFWRGILKRRAPL